MQILQLLYVVYASTCISTFHPKYGTNGCDIVVKAGQMTINNIPINSTWTYEGFYRALGKPTKRDDRKETHDTRGLVIWRESSNDKEVSQLLVQFAYDPNETAWYTSTVYFSGTLKIEGVSITGHTPLTDLKQNLPQYNWEKNVSGWYEGIFNGIFMYFAYDSEEKNILWIDFGLDDEDDWN